MIPENEAPGSRAQITLQQINLESSSDLSKIGKISALNKLAHEPFKRDSKDLDNWVSTLNKDCWGSVFLYITNYIILL
jgi:hypothetical protein